MSKFKIIAAAAALGVLVLAAYLAPRFADQNVLRAWVGPQLQRALHQEVSIGGAIDFALLPRPMVRGRQITIGPADHRIADIPEIEAKLKFWPLLAGRLEPDELVLSRPDIHLGGLPASQPPAAAAAPAASSTDGPAAPAAKSFKPKDAGIILIEDGKLTVSGLTLSPVDLKIVTADDKISLSGRANAGRTGMQIDGDMQWKDGLVQASALALRVDGGATVSWAGQGDPLTGELTARVEDSTLLFGEKAPPGPLALSGEVSVKPGELDVADLLLTVRDAEFRGDGQFVTGDTPRVGVHLRTSLGNSEISLTGAIEKDGHLAGSFEGKSDDLRGFLRWADLDPSRVPADRLRAVQLAGQIKGDFDQITLEGVRVKLDSSILDLSATIRPGPRPAIGVTFALDNLNGDAYWPDHPVIGAPGPVSAPANPAAPPAPEKRSVAGFDVELHGRIGHLVWFGQTVNDLALDTRVVTDTAGHWNEPSLALSVPVFSLGKVNLDHVAVTMALPPGRVVFDHLAAGLYGGQLTGEGSVSEDGGPSTLHLALSHAQMKKALLEVADIGLADGELSGEINLTTKGKPNEMQANLAGTGSILVKNGTIHGFDLKAADDKLKGKEGIGGLLALIAVGVTGGDTHFSSLSATAKADHGMIETRDVKLDAEGGDATGVATVNLPGDAIDAHADFHFANAHDAPPLTMRLQGSLHSPHRYLDVKPLQEWLSEHGLKTGKPKDVLKGLLQGLSKQ